ALETGAVLEPVSGKIPDFLPRSVPVEPDLTAALGVSEEPLRLDARIAQFEAVRPADAVRQDEVGLVKAGFLRGFRIESELVAGDALVRGPFRVRGENDAAHVPERLDDVGLAGGVG